MKILKPYPFIRANSIYWGSYPYWTEDELIRAKVDDAPKDAVYWIHDEEGNRVWTTMKELKLNRDERHGEAYDKLMYIATARGWVVE